MMEDVCEEAIISMKERLLLLDLHPSSDGIGVTKETSSGMVADVANQLSSAATNVSSLFQGMFRPLSSAVAQKPVRKLLGKLRFVCVMKN